MGDVALFDSLDSGGAAAVISCGAAAMIDTWTRLIQTGGSYRRWFPGV